MTDPSYTGDELHDAGLLVAHAFGLLASAELGHWPEWTGPADGRALRARVEALTLLFDLIPHSELSRLDAVLSAWSREFPGREPVSARQLRASARTELSIRKADKAASSGMEEWFQRAATLARLRGTDVTKSTVSASAPEWRDAEAQRQCVQGLGTWLALSMQDERWTRLPAIIPGDAPIDMQQVYVELNVIPTEELRADAIAQITKLQRMPRQRITSEYGVMSAASLVARTLERCIVIGEPGSGKSTLMQWLAWAANQAMLPDFDAALFVKLSGYAAALEKRPQLSILEYFFESLDAGPADWRPAASWMRRVASESRRYLLLLDGWDEVPAARREAVRQRMAEEGPCFVTVITSRPAGLPLQLLTVTPVELCGIAPLSETATEEMVAKLLRAQGKSERRETIVKRIREDSDFREMTGNPFLLGLLVGILARAADSESASWTRAHVYQQVVAWLTDQYNQAADSAGPLTVAHLDGLRRLSYGLLFEGDSARYVFGARELVERLRSVTPEAVLRSRFVNRIDLLCDEHSFLHATFQEFFAAAHAATLPDDAIDPFLDRAFRSLSRLIVLEFASGMDGRLSARCRLRATEWLKHRDRYLQTSLRVSKLIAAGRWPRHGLAESVLSVQEELWQVIVANADMGLTKAAVQAFAAIDAVELCRRAVRQQDLPTWAVNCMTSAVPAAIALREGLDELLTGEWETHAGIEVRGGATLAEVKAIRMDLADETLAEEDRREAAIRAGAARDRGAVPLLIGILSSGMANRGLLEQVIFSLGLIGGRDAMEALISLVLGEQPMADELVRIAVAGLRHVANGRKALDPIGRDCLLRRLTALSPEAPRVIFMLAALEGFPVRDGAAVVAEIAQDSHLDSDRRVQAVRVLATATERAIVQESVSSIASEPAATVAASLLQVAVQRGLSVPWKWLQGAIQSCRDRIELHQLVKAFVLLLPNAPSADQRKAANFLHRLIAEAMRANASADDDRAKALVQALSAGGHSGRPYLSKHSFELARFALARFAEAPATVSEGCVLLAAAVLAHFQSPGSGVALHKAVDAALQTSGDRDRTGQALDRLATALAKSLATVAPGELLSYPASCTPVDGVLRAQALRKGWMIFADRITDAEGVEIARKGDVEAVAGTSAPLELSDVIRELPRTRRHHLESYLLMVGPGGPCEPTDSLRVIHAALVDRWSGEAEDDLTEALGRLYPDDPPTLAAWKKALSRIETQFKRQPQAEALLRQYGLYRREDL